MVQQPPQVRPQPRVIRQRQARAEVADPLAVGLQPGGVHPVQRVPLISPITRSIFLPPPSVLAPAPLPIRTRHHALLSLRLQEATDRGFVFQCTDTEAFDAALRAGVVSVYIGFDCTADSLHVGNLVGIMILRLLQKHGHRPVALIGGGTTRIGDPSGKDESRQLLTDAQITANMAGIRRCFARFCGSAPTRPMMVRPTPSCRTTTTG